MASDLGWTNERVEDLKRLWRDGLSCSQIARKLGEGFSRNAVIGKVTRLKLDRRASVAPRDHALNQASAGKAPKPVSKPAAVKTPAPIQKVTSTLTGLIVPGAPKDADTRPLRSAAWEPLPGSNPVKVADHKHGCRFPVDWPGEKIARFCGNPLHDDGPYCRDHSRV